MTETAPDSCSGCGTVLGRGMLACPRCGRIVYAGTLKQMAEKAAEAEAAGDRERAILEWRSALQYLPPQAGQWKTIEQTIQRLERERKTPGNDKDAIEKKSKSWAKWLGVAAPAIAFLVTKGKFVLLGFTKLPTLLSMFWFLGVYWREWGWAFALGFMLCIYLHEMGHDIALRHYGIPASAPLFVPGFGAVIFAKQHIDSPAEDARVGLAGPAAGLLAAIGCYALYAATGNALFAALTVFGALVNLFNLLPILFLDGSRAMRGLSRSQRWVLAGVGATCFVALGSNLSLAIALVIAGRQFLWKHRDADSAPDKLTFATFAVLLVVLAVLTNVPAPTPETLQQDGPRGPA